ncbi:MAG TPA: hypothetical protein VKZ95_02400 [Sphingobacteriaceae bacterium]|nr:hypothetical protein [Sphingobacteriaceae bacterium]
MILHFILIIITAFLIGLFLPWWGFIVAVFLLSFWLSKTTKSAFLISFFAVFLLWMTLNIYYSHLNEHILSRRVAELFGLGGSSYNWLLIILLSPLPGAITAGFAGVSGNLAKQLLLKK